MVIGKVPVASHTDHLFRFDHSDPPLVLHRAKHLGVSPRPRSHVMRRSDSISRALTVKSAERNLSRTVSCMRVRSAAPFNRHPRELSRRKGLSMDTTRERERTSATGGA